MVARGMPVHQRHVGLHRQPDAAGRGARHYPHAEARPDTERDVLLQHYDATVRRDHLRRGPVLDDALEDPDVGPVDTNALALIYL